MVWVQFSLVADPSESDRFVKMPCVPREGETVDIPGVSQADTVVRTIVWLPFLEDQPDVYIVLGKPRRSYTTT